MRWTLFQAAVHIIVWWDLDRHPSSYHNSQVRAMEEKEKKATRREERLEERRRDRVVAKYIRRRTSRWLKHLLFRGSEKPELFWWSSTAVSDLPWVVFLLTPRLRALLNALRCLGPLLEQLVQRVHLWFGGRLKQWMRGKTRVTPSQLFCAHLTQFFFSKDKYVLCIQPR